MYLNLRAHYATNDDRLMTRAATIAPRWLRVAHSMQINAPPKERVMSSNSALQDVMPK